MNETNIVCPKTCLECQQGHHHNCNGVCGCLTKLEILPNQNTDEKYKDSLTNMTEKEKTISCQRCFHVVTCQMYNVAGEMLANYNNMFKAKMTRTGLDGKPILFDANEIFHIHDLAKLCPFYAPPDSPLFKAKLKASESSAI